MVLSNDWALGRNFYFVGELLMASPLTVSSLDLLAKFELDLEVSDGTYPLINFYFWLGHKNPHLGVY
jgi:hypothetical protein